MKKDMQQKHIPSSISEIPFAPNTANSYLLTSEVVKRKPLPRKLGQIKQRSSPHMHMSAKHSGC